MLIGNDAFQEVDIVGITRPCTKHNYLVSDVDRLASTIKEAFYLAAAGRPGPVLIDLPKDVIQSEAEFKYPRKVNLRGYQPNVNAHPKQLRKAVDLLLAAKRPVIYSGGGTIIAGAHRELKALAETLRIPVTTTLMGLGGFPGTHELSLGMLGMHGTYRANMAVQNCDLLVAVGARFDDRVTGKIDEFCPKAQIIHIDIDPTSIKKNVSVHVPIVADCANALKGLLETSEGTPGKAGQKRQAQTFAQGRGPRPLAGTDSGLAGNLSSGLQPGTGRAHQAPVRG